jgi:hypothetical protein
MFASRSLVVLIAIVSTGCFTTSGATYRLPGGSETVCRKPTAWVWLVDSLPYVPIMSGPGMMDAYANCKTQAEGSGGIRIDKIDLPERAPTPEWCAQHPAAEYQCQGVGATTR